MHLVWIGYGGIILVVHVRINGKSGDSRMAGG